MKRLSVFFLSFALAVRAQVEPPRPIGSPMAQDMSPTEAGVMPVVGAPPKGKGAEMSEGGASRAVPCVSAYGVRVDVPSGDVRDVLRAVSDSAGLSVVIPGDLVGTVSTRLDSVPYADAFTAVLSPRGYSWRVLPSGLVVIEKSVRRSSFSVSVRRRLAADIASAILPVLRDGESVHALGSDLIIDAEPDRCSFLADRIRSLDCALRQVFVDFRFEELSTQASRALGLKWSSLGNYGVSLSPNAYPVGSGSSVFSGVIKADQLAVIVSALDTSAGTSVVSRPTLLASENRESIVAIGQQYPLPQYTFSSEQSVLQVSGFQFKDVGVLTKVTPRFLSDGRVLLRVQAEVSSVISTTTFAGAGAATLPVIATRRVETEVELSDGDTIAVSGLISTSEDDTSSGVRGLARVPLLGGLFRSRDSKKDRSELVVFLSVRFCPVE